MCQAGSIPCESPLPCTPSGRRDTLEPRGSKGVPPGRALEIILGCKDFDAEDVERCGWVNRALPPEALGPFVENLVRRIASYSAQAIALARHSVNAAAPTFLAGLIEENRAFNRAPVTEEAQL